MHRQLFNAQTRKLVTAREAVAKRDGKIKTAPAAAEAASDDEHGIVNGEAADHDAEGMRDVEGISEDAS